jgi:hypothetical protein
MKDSTDPSPVETSSAAASSSARRRRALGRFARKAYERGYRDALLYQADLLNGVFGDVITSSIVTAYLDGRADAGDDPVLDAEERLERASAHRHDVATRLRHVAYDLRWWAWSSDYGTLRAARRDARRRAQRPQETVTSTDDPSTR